MGQGGQGQVRVGSSGQAGNVSLWRGANRLGAALLGFSFKHHDSGVETEKNKNKETGLGLPPSSRESSSSLRFADSSAERPSSVFQRGLLGRLGPQLHGRGSECHFTEQKTEAQSGNVIPQSHTGSASRTRLRISDVWAVRLPLTKLPGGSGARLGHGSLLKQPFRFSKTSHCSKSNVWGAEGKCSWCSARKETAGFESLPYYFPAGDSSKTLNPLSAQCLHLEAPVPAALLPWSCSRRQCLTLPALRPCLRSSSARAHRQRACLRAAGVYRRLPPRPLPLDGRRALRSNMSKTEFLVPAFPTCSLLQAKSTVAHSATQTPDLRPSRLLVFLHSHIWALKRCFQLYLHNHS